MKMTWVLLAFLAGCASLNKNECRTADWYAIGLEDGSRGRTLERLGDHRRACAEHGVTPQTERYLAGRKDGLMGFCTYERGYSLGRGGRAYSNACPPETAGAFRAGFQRGHDLRELQRRLDEARSEIERSKAALAAGIPGAQARAAEVVRLEAALREAAQLEEQIRSLE